MITFNMILLGFGKRKVILENWREQNRVIHDNVAIAILPADTGDRVKVVQYIRAEEDTADSRTAILSIPDSSSPHDCILAGFIHAELRREHGSSTGMRPSRHRHSLGVKRTSWVTDLSHSGWTKNGITKLSQIVK